MENSSKPEEPTPTNPETPTKPKKKLVLIISAVVTLLLICGLTAFFLLKPKDSIDNATESSDQALASSLKLLGNEVSDFDLSFLKLENSAENKIYSPLSIKYALAMLSAGANGNTKQQIDSILGDYQFKKYLNSDHLSLANAFFIRNQYKTDVSESFIGALKTDFNAEVIFDDFSSAKNINSWVSKNTFKQIPKLFDDAQIQDPSNRLALINALAIDMKWTNLTQCTAAKKSVPCKYSSYWYTADYPHEDYIPASASRIDAEEDDTYGKTIKFNYKSGTKALEIAANINNYDIIKDVGESKIRETVQSEYKKWLKTEKKEWCEDLEEDEECSYGEDWKDHIAFDLEEYMKDLKSNYGQNSSSTDFYTFADDSISVFAKDLQKYDGTTLQYIGVMPKSGDLTAYINELTAEKANTIINNLKPIQKSSFEEGYITKITGDIPIFNFDYSLKLVEDLKQLGITDVFSEQDADLSNMISHSATENYFVTDAVHKANIDFSNEGIKAAAATGILAGAGGGADGFDYLWKVPIKEIDLTFDRPYLFLIRDKASNEVWFIGTVYQPSHE